MELRERIEKVLAPLDGGSVYDAIMLLTEHVRRHNELVALEHDISAYYHPSMMPDDRLDQLETQRAELRQQIWSETRLSGEGEADVEQAEKAPTYPCQQISTETRGVSSEPFVVGVAGSGFTDFVSREELAAANDRIKKLEAALAMARHECNSHEHAANILDRRVEELEATARRYQQRIDEKTDEINELKQRLADRDADAELGKMIRGLRPKGKHRRVMAVITKATLLGEWAATIYAIRWENCCGGLGLTVNTHYSLADAIREYNGRED